MGVCPTSPLVLCGSGEGIRPCPSWYSVGSALGGVPSPGWVERSCLKWRSSNKYLGVLFTSEGKMEREIDKRIGAASAVMRSVYWTVNGEEGAESKGEAALDLPDQSTFPPSPTVMNFG
ncbi:hypothetical protein L3Q82_021513 [Scortum barcoo]|uniref:Uncharacterized protein n=1 Tax=Scortum barcoo TaxID=214431 RepID=A0ACB8X4T1_9TELE|nr:hypothetical protein L3Q82_021513 [Scortum barcoo]